VYQRTVKITIGTGSVKKLMLVIEDELVGPMVEAPGFIAYLAVPAGKDSVFTTRIFDDKSTLEAEQHASQAVAQAIAERFEFTALEGVVEGETGVYKALI
jgi:hypothetical protein